MVSNIEKYDDHIAIVIGRNIKALREAARISRRELAALMEISYQQLYKFERGQNRISAEQIVLLKFHLGATYNEFFRELF